MVCLTLPRRPRKATTLRNIVSAVWDTIYRKKKKKQTNKVRMIRCCVRQVVINMLYNIASKFV